MDKCAVEPAWREIVHWRAHEILNGDAQTVDAIEAIDEVLVDFQNAS